jgi:rod shape-determining protein MreD
MDVISGSALGVHVLAYAVISYLILNMHHRLKMFPIVQQSCVMFILVATQLMLVSLLNTVLTSSGTDLSYLWVALSSAIIWPFVLLATDRLSMALR